MSREMYSKQQKLCIKIVLPGKYALENIPKPAAPEENGLLTSFPWRLAALTLLTLCLALMVGLLALGSLFFQVISICQEENVKLKEKEKALQTNFSSRLQEIRDSLCLEGEAKNKNNGMSCILCPTNWQQMGDNTCYYNSSEKKTWNGSRNFCASQNSTLLMIKDKEKLLLKAWHLNDYWVISEIHIDLEISLLGLVNLT
ncbi:C-type lectin domain family 1 member A-like [Trachemys scripta elegans]|uniref:C-type lectin domain family 1 member A-like n=1 Tax=Trachemys scripta elegans TaxID=31138 RepID=UPI0015533C16|nr:C-type lectin domain family 1 member A-like [Trachemys scripta elegans]